MTAPKGISEFWINEALFWSRVTRTDTCWLWDNPMESGYGQFWVGRKRDGTRTRALAHRVAWVIIHGDDPPGESLDHVCRVRHCVNPDHLDPVSVGENVLRGINPAATNARRKFCKYGHPLEGDNLYEYTDKNGKRMRQCRECRRQRNREQYERDRLDPEKTAQRLEAARVAYHRAKDEHAKATE